MKLYLCPVIKKKVMEKSINDVKDVKNDWLLKVSSKTKKGLLQIQYFQYLNKTKEEIMLIADSRFSSFQFLVRVYKLEKTL